MMTAFTKHQRFALVLLALAGLGLLPPVSSAREMPAPIRSDSSINLHRLGDTTVTWFGFTLYEAALWSENEFFDGLEYTQPVMLSITYRKSISSEQLLESTDKLWRKLKPVDSLQRQRWLNVLETIWPDVEPGDVIASVVVPGHETRFYSKNTLLGVIDDPDFGPAFLDIWLSPESTLKNVRKQLLKLTGV